MHSEPIFDEAKIEEVRQVLLDIVQLGILRIRGSGWDGDAERCSVEADHIHNLPDLISRPSLELLAYYMEIERPSFIHFTEDHSAFEPHWSRLQKLVGEGLTSIES